MKKLILAAAILTVAGLAGLALSTPGNARQATDFWPGHTHGPDGTAIGAPAHSGGLDAYGCHNGSVPYHCHR